VYAYERVSSCNHPRPKPQKRKTASHPTAQTIDALINQVLAIEDEQA